MTKISSSSQGSQVPLSKGNNNGEGGGGDFQLTFNFDETGQQQKGGVGNPANPREGEMNKMSKNKGPAKVEEQSGRGDMLPPPMSLGLGGRETGNQLNGLADVSQKSPPRSERVRKRKKKKLRNRAVSKSADGTIRVAADSHVARAIISQNMDAKGELGGAGFPNKAESQASGSAMAKSSGAGSSSSASFHAESSANSFDELAQQLDAKGTSGKEGGGIIGKAGAPVTSAPVAKDDAVTADWATGYITRLKSIGKDTEQLSVSKDGGGGQDEFNDDDEEDEEDDDEDDDDEDDDEDHEDDEEEEEEGICP